MDYLDKLIQLAQVEGKIDVQCRFSGNWQVDHPQEPNLLGIFHLVSHGECYVKLLDQQFHLTQGDVLFLPQGVAHHLENAILSSEPLQPITHYLQGALTLKSNCEKEFDFEMFCGHFYYNGHLSPLFQLPEYWRLSLSSEITSALLNLLKNEADRGLGSRSTIDALCHVLLTYLIRDYLEKNQAKGVLAALQDKRLYPAINAMLLTPEQPWNMESLAELCAMSRASFIRLFKQKTAYLPGRFLTDLRMQKANLLLKKSSQSILAVALAVGYQSETYFSKTFKTYYGVSPAKFRQTV
ncbi:histidine kinase [Pasteurellaceae bacterium Orientalotternb1]|nr:histidine kinase [Pasteurellaceae bacterium Orientalotternb1]